jgi:hypothetical protein
MSARRITCMLALALCAVLAPTAAGREPGEPAAQARAETALAEAIEALDPPAPAMPTRELTAILAELNRVAPALERPERRVARSILARPDDGAADQWGDGYTVDDDEILGACDARFCVHWVERTADAPPLGDTDADGIPDFVEAVQRSAARSAAVQNGALGWTEPVGDGPRGGEGTDLTDIYLVDLNGAYFGYASPDEGQAGDATAEAYLVLDEDYVEFATSELTTLQAMRVTMAHEYNHVLQFAYDALEQSWMFESTATWVEDHVYPRIDDYLNYLPSLAASSTVPITGNDYTGLKVYGAAAWNHYLSSVHGPDAVREAWEDSAHTDTAHLAVAAYDSALGGAGANPFDLIGDEFARFAASTAEWRSLPATYPDAARYPGVWRLRRLRMREPLEVSLDHLSYALLSIAPRAARSGDLRLVAHAPDGTHFAIDLVGRRGAAVGGSVSSDTVLEDDGGRAEATLAARRYRRITAVVANADPRYVSGHYARNNQRLRLRLTR